MSVPPVRLAALLALALLPAGLSWWLTTEAAAAWSVWAGPARTADAGMVAVAGGLGALVAVWLALGAVVSGVWVLSGASRRPALVPAVLHRSVALLLGVALAAGAAPASPVPLVGSSPDPAWTSTAVGAAAAPVRTDRPPLAIVPDPGWRPVQAASPRPRSVAEPIDPLLLSGSRPGAADSTETVTVRRGDTLWDLAARHLGAGATDGEIAAEWPRWYAANQETVGADPDLLLPGQQLAPPGRVNGG